MEPWSIVADHPDSGEPFGLVICDNSTLAEAELLAKQILATFKVLGSYVPTSCIHPTHGHYLFYYRLTPYKTTRLATIWSQSANDAILRLNTLAADGILLMPASG